EPRRPGDDDEPADAPRIGPAELRRPGAALPEPAAHPAAVVHGDGGPAGVGPMAAQRRNDVPARRSPDAVGQPRRLGAGLARLFGTAGGKAPRPPPPRRGGRVSPPARRLPDGAAGGAFGARRRFDQRAAMVFRAGVAPAP